MAALFPSLDEVVNRATRGDASLTALSEPLLQWMKEDELSRTHDAVTLVESFVAALGSSLPRRLPLLTEGERSAARACLRGLGLWVQIGSDEREAIRKQAHTDALIEAGTRERYGEGKWCCPRCGSGRVNEGRSDRGRTRSVDLLCEACGAFGASDHDVSRVNGWVRT